MKKMNNNDKTYLDDVVMEEEKMEEKFEIQPSLQIEENINANEREEKMKEILKKLHLQKRKWRHDSINALCWSFYCVNDNKPVNVKWF